MTVPASTTTFRYEGNGVTAIFAYSNRLLGEVDVRVQILTRATSAVVETLTRVTDYTVTIVSNSLANITIINPAKIPSVTQDILLTLNLDISQTRSYPRADSLPAADIERGLDKLTLIAQKLDDQLALAIRFPDSDTTSNGELPSAGFRASKYLAFDSDGEPVASAGTDTITSPFGATLIEAADANEAKTILEVIDVPYTNASASAPAALDFAEQTTNGTHKSTLRANPALAADSISTLPSYSATLVGSLDIKSIADGRLTLTSGTPVTTSDVTGATSIYYTPYIGNQIGLYTGSAWVSYTFAELSLALGTLTSGLPYDVFLDYNDGTPQLTMTAWTNGTTRATALVRQDGILVKTGDTQQRYLGTFYTISTTQTADSSTVGRYVWNYYNRVDRFMVAADTANSWTYSANSYQQANANTANQLNFVVGVAEDAIRANLLAFGETSGATARTIYAAIGLDSTTTPTGQWTFGVVSTATFGRQFNAKYEGIPGIGVHFLAWLERGAGADTQTWYGDSGGTMLCGITGIIKG